jgi:hypothetical protein
VTSSTFLSCSFVSSCTLLKTLGLDLLLVFSQITAHFGPTSSKSSTNRPESSQRSPSNPVAELPHHPAYAAGRLAPAFALYRPPLLTDRPPMVDPYATIPFFTPSAYPALDPAHYSPYYRGFALLPPPGPGYNKIVSFQNEFVLTLSPPGLFQWP